MSSPVITLHPVVVDEVLSESSTHSAEYPDITCPGPFNRVKVFFIGDCGVGKTSLLQSLMSYTAKIADQATEGVAVHIWCPFKHRASVDNANNDMLSGEQKQLTLELWDLTGKPVCQGVHQTYLTSSALYIIVFNCADQSSINEVPTIVNNVQMKVPGACMLLVGTHVDKLSSEDLHADMSETLLSAIRSMEQLTVTKLRVQLETIRSHRDQMCSLTKITEIQTVLKMRPKIHSYVFIISSSIYQGIDNLRQVILKKVLDVKRFPHIKHAVNEGTLNIFDSILNLREKGVVVLMWKQFLYLLSKEAHIVSDDAIEEETEYLHSVGAILDVRLLCCPADSNKNTQSISENAQRIICIHPSALANALCLIHLEDDKKQFKLDPQRFWPRESGFKKPDVELLVWNLESIPKEGMVREVLLPILWQELWLSESQIQQLLYMLKGLGFLVESLALKNHCEGLAMPHYLTLSATHRFYIPLFDLLPNNEPNLNWTTKPFRGDIQIGWRIHFIHGAPPGVTNRLFSCCRNTYSTSSYNHDWNHGSLFRVGEVMICLKDERQSDNMDILCRINADEPGREEDAVMSAWIYLSPFLNVVLNFMNSWPGTGTVFYLLPLGKQLFHGEKFDVDPVFGFLDCLSQWRTGQEAITFYDIDRELSIDLSLLFPFKGTDREQIVDLLSFVKVLLSKQSSVIWENQAHPSYTRPSSSRQSVSRKNSQKPKKKKLSEIKWNLTHVPTKESWRKDSSSLDAAVRDSNNENQNADIIQVEPYREQETATTSDDNGGEMGETKQSVDLAENEKTHLSPSDSSNRVQLKPDNYNHKTDHKSDHGSLTTTPSPALNSNAMGHKVVTAEEETREYMRVASAFAAAILASAVAEVVSAEFKGQKNKNSITPAEVTAAKVTAQAAIATQTGDVTGAGQAVIDATRTVHAAVNQSNSSKMVAIVRSKTCTIL